MLRVVRAPQTGACFHACSPRLATGIGLAASILRSSVCEQWRMHGKPVPPASPDTTSTPACERSKSVGVCTHWTRDVFGDPDRRATCVPLFTRFPEAQPNEPSPAASASSASPSSPNTETDGQAGPSAHSERIRV
jgi:hypothetical protein